MLIKLIYFEEESFLPVTIRDLVEAVESQRSLPTGGMLGGLEQLLQGGNMENLMKMLGDTDL